MNLGEIFPSVACKQIVAVDLPDRASHQHEINGTGVLRTFFGTDSRFQGEIGWHYFSDDDETVNEVGSLTFYNARERSAERTGRSEWRLYYRGDFFQRANEGDVLFLLKDWRGNLHGLVFQRESALLRAATVLFDQQDVGPQIRLIDNEVLKNNDIEFVRSRILDELRLSDTIPIVSSDEELVIRRFSKGAGLAFPHSLEMSQLARESSGGNTDNADIALSTWLDREERLFRALERHIVTEHLDRGFASVDEFVEFSLSVLNRRKARAGLALENHLSALFGQRGVKFERTAVTEGKNRPDFLFPGSVEYHSPSFDPDRLLMLGAKTSCKDRWRQVLTEAERIKNKHLCTLETSISVDQTNEMKRQGLTLVLPQQLHQTYTPEQRVHLMSVEQFIECVARKQK